jgi:hypothetical protein
MITAEGFQKTVKFDSGDSNAGAPVRAAAVSQKPVSGQFWAIRSRLVVSLLGRTRANR